MSKPFPAFLADRVQTTSNAGNPAIEDRIHLSCMSRFVFILFAILLQIRDTRILISLR